MGCDIHLHTERKRTINNEQKWVCADHFSLNPYFGYEGESEYTLVRLQRRNYGLFSMLADVRNYADGASAPVKGLPEDVTELVRKDSDAWGPDGHSHSYLTMKELYDFFEANPTQKYSGLVDKDGEAAIDRGEMPEWWCQESSMPLVKREWEQPNTTMKEFIEKMEEHFDSDYYNKERDAENCRIVFWFDN